MAVVGGGPAGLTCAYFLTLKGYEGDYFREVAKHLGGMLRYGIPEYRLPKALLDREIKWITDLGGRGQDRGNRRRGLQPAVAQGKRIRRDLPRHGRAKSKNAWAWRARRTIRGIIGGIDFLRQMQAPDAKAVTGVSGRGGRRQHRHRRGPDGSQDRGRKGRSPRRRTMKEMPAHQMEIDAAAEEGVEMRFLSAPVAIVAQERQTRGPAVHPDGVGRAGCIAAADAR